MTGRDPDLTALVETADRIAGLDAARTTTSSNRSTWKRCSRGCAHSCAGRATTASPPPPATGGRGGRPAGAAAPDGGGLLTAAGLRMDVQARRAWRGTRELELTRTEFDLLELLVRNAGIVLDHATIYDRIWGYDFGPGSKNLAVYVGYLRRKLDEPGGRR
ncbi:winged helix-turn-helix domain-containing protein [Streptomyces stelliscabiei]